MVAQSFHSLSVKFFNRKVKVAQGPQGLFYYITFRTYLITNSNLSSIRQFDNPPIPQVICLDVRFQIENIYLSLLPGILFRTDYAVKIPRLWCGYFHFTPELCLTALAGKGFFSSNGYNDFCSSMTIISSLRVPSGCKALDRSRSRCLARKG